jgi:hypothetical protein
MAAGRGKLQLRASQPPAQTLVAMSNQPPENATPEQPVAAQVLSTGRRDREGKRLIAGHFSKATWATLRDIGTRTEKTSQELLQEALDDLFAKYRRRQQ